MRGYGLRRSGLINAFWVPLHFQDTALIAISVPAALVTLAPVDHVRIFAVVAALVSLVAMVVPPIAGGISDRLRSTLGVPRRVFIVGGAALDLACLLMMARVNTLSLFVLFLLLATVAANIALAAYQALLPDIVPEVEWGSVSGVRSVAMVVGTVVGIAVAAGTLPQSAFIGIAVCIGLGAMTLFAVAETRASSEREEPAHISDWHDFSIVFVARAFLAFGLSLLMTFVLYFFRDILHYANPSAGTGGVAAASLFGAIGSGIYLGWLSDRVPRKYVVAACGVPMTLAAIGFALAPQAAWMYVFAVLFGAGFGGIMSTGWALAMDSVPKLRDVGRDLGIWGIAQNLPSVAAPLIGGWVLMLFGGSLMGYRVLFFTAGASFALGSATVLAVGRRPVVPWWVWPIRRLAARIVLFVTPWTQRVRSWGRIPYERGATLLVANHQLETDLFIPLARLSLHSSRRSPVVAVAARLMHEQGFLALRFPRARMWLRRFSLGWLLESMGFLPLENQLQVRSALRWAASIEERRGVVPLAEAVKPSALEAAGFTGLTTHDLFKPGTFDRACTVSWRLTDVLASHRMEQLEITRERLTADIARLERALQQRATVVVTPEGEYSQDGGVQRFRRIWERLEPLASDIYLIAIAYDPFVGTRLSQLYRVVPLRDRARIREELAASRPVTASALLSAWTLAQNGPFTRSDAIAGVGIRLAALPPSLFVDPELAAQPERVTASAIDGMLRLGVLNCTGDEYRLSTRRSHPAWPAKVDVVAYQARILAETLAAANSLGVGTQAVAAS